MRTRVLSVVFVLGLFVVGCDFTSPESDAPPRPLSSAEKQTVRSGNDFGLKLFRAVHAANEEKPNVILSPPSVSMALGMTLNGAEGKTRTAMEETLERNDLSPAEINDAYRSLIDLLLGLDSSVQMKIPNSIWHRNTFSVEQPFLETNREHFDATIEALDFSSPSAVDRINEWVATSTEGTIDEIIQGPIPRVTMMYLINAVYFKGNWRQKFDPDETKPAPFHLPDGSTTEVDMMKIEEPTFPMSRTDRFTAVDLAYGDSLYTMTILLPKEDVSVDSVAENLDKQSWKRVTTDLAPQRLSSFEMPKFTLRYKTELKQALQSLGMGVAFDPQRANFDAINPDVKDLHVDAVKHKTFLKVNEEGTEASAATSVSIGITSAPPSIRVDRPFAFVLRERHSGTILFIGSVTNPTV